MPFESLDEFIRAADAVGEVLHVDGAHLKLGRRLKNLSD
jgi:hypothetical protein